MDLLVLKDLPRPGSTRFSSVSNTITTRKLARFDVAHFDCFIRLRIGILGLKAVSWFLRVFSGHVWILFGFESTDALAL